MYCFTSILKYMQLFESIETDSISKVIRCLEGHTKTFKKGQIIYNYFDQINYAGVVLEGQVSATMINSCGNEYSVRNFCAGKLFGEAYSCAPEEPSAIQLTSTIESKVLFLKLSNLFKNQSFHCPYSSQITANLLKEIAKNNLYQNQKLQILTQKNIRDRLVVYLRSLKMKDNTVVIPFNRQELANYIGAERSALSRELSKMKNDKLININKRQITILSKDLLKILK